MRRATRDDLPAILALEQAAFQPWRQSSVQSLRRSLTSPRQSVWVIDAPGPGAQRPGIARSPATRRGQLARDDAIDPIGACLVLWHHVHTLRVYGIATRPDMQGQGLGRELMRHAEALGRRGGMQRVVLEADASDAPLLAWYEAQGYHRARRIAGFYAPRRHAWRLEKGLDQRD